MARLHELADRAEDLGIAEPLADVLEAYIAQAEVASDAYEDFHWGKQSEGGEIVRIPPPPLVVTGMGPLVEIVYESTKGGTMAHWVHPFDDPRPVLAFEEMSDQLYIIGGGYNVTHRGIVG